ncbi:MAG: tetratricopeptide repeat protein [Myxococcota bacterium]
MPASSTKTLSPAELAKLEHAFATDPSSDAYKPLAEAYLGMGRFMEAMVVCKKGVKAHPTAADPRVLLARVYAEQGKDKKALEELQGALQVAPSDKAVLRLAGALQLKTGEADTGRANLLKAYEADPSDEETKALLVQWKVEPPKRAAPVAVAHDAPPVLTPVLRSGGARPPSHGEPPAAPAKARAPVNGSQPQPRSSPAPARAPAPAAARAAAKPSRVPRKEYDDDISEVSEVIELSRRSRKKGGSKGAFLFLLFVLPLGLGVYWGVGRWQAMRNREIAKLLTEAEEQLKPDSFDAYKKATEAAGKVLDLDPNDSRAHGFLAYAYAIRWGEHGDVDAQEKASKHVEAAKGSGKPSAHLVAADALVKTYSGKGSEALKDLEGSEKKGPLLYLTLGLVQMNNGDLERARESFDAAAAQSSGDPRIFAALGNLYRRRGQDIDALRNFDFALRYQTDHHESMLGKCFLVLEQESPDRNYIGAAKMLKKLIDSVPPPSRRQLATAFLLRSLLISRVANDLPLYTSEAFKKELTEGTGVGTDKAKNNAEIAKAEEDGFALDKGNPELLLIKARRLYYEKSYDAAVTELRKAISADGSRAHYHVELARSLKQKGAHAEAEDALKKALTMVPDSPKLQTLLADAYLAQKKFDDALAQYERAVRDEKAKNPDARFAMGRIYREMKKDFPKAITSFERSALEYVGRTDMVANSYAQLGLTHEAKGDEAKARESYERALNADKDLSGPYFLLAKLLAANPKERGKAKELAREYLKLSPRGEYAEAAQRLAR